MTKRVFANVLGLLVLAAGTPSASAPTYDGEWSGTMTYDALTKNRPARGPSVVANEKYEYRETGPTYALLISGQLDSGEQVLLRVSIDFMAGVHGSSDFSGKIDGDRLDVEG